MHCDVEFLETDSGEMVFFDVMANGAYTKFIVAQDSMPPCDVELLQETFSAAEVWAVMERAIDKGHLFLGCNDDDLAAMRAGDFFTPSDPSLNPVRCLELDRLDNLVTAFGANGRYWHNEFHFDPVYQGPYDFCEEHCEHDIKCVEHGFLTSAINDLYASFSLGITFSGEPLLHSVHFTFSNSHRYDMYALLKMVAKSPDCFPFVDFYGNSPQPNIYYRMPQHERELLLGTIQKNFDEIPIMLPKRSNRLTMNHYRDGYEYEEDELPHPLVNLIMGFLYEAHDNWFMDYHLQGFDPPLYYRNRWGDPRVWAGDKKEVFEQTKAMRKE